MTTLGPVHPAELTEDLFTAVLDAAKTDRFLLFDKDQRWGGAKDEQVLAEAISHGPTGTDIPAQARRAGGTLKLHHYGSVPLDLPALLDRAAKLAADHRAAKAKVLWFQPTEPGPDSSASCVRIQLKTFDPSTAEKSPKVAIIALDALPADHASSFAEFARQMAADGFAFLWDRHQASGMNRPVLTVLVDSRVGSAIGPMTTMADSLSRPRLLPQYFRVLPEHRSLGRSLWRAAMNWGHKDGASYQLLQTELDAVRLVVPRGGPGDPRLRVDRH
ncbi:GNAT family N-acetyltransferase [Streptomyces sp. NRRL S-495]|uniref:GNAT family N-acetyltransferase n=1 Tax=Streptomyces sp. NRRL S-495 TaxID=1609133 RepID=UPI0025704F6F|nr:GNAT family N-acetyltransferase [Streptomyces sp. NRRL S-495]